MKNMRTFAVPFEGSPTGFFEEAAKVKKMLKTLFGG